MSAEGERPRLLVIDDEPELCAYVASAGVRAGYAVQTSSDPTQLAAFYDDSLTAITLDLQMPQMDGIELLRQLAAKGCRARIILMSGFDAKLLQTAERLGIAQGLNIVGHLVKPVRAPELIALLTNQIVSVKRKAKEEDISEADLRRAIKERQLVVHYQPQVNLRNGEIAGVEALVRWQHPERGLLYPDAFIALAERCGLGLALTEVVLDQALTHCAERTASGATLPMLSVNLPPEALTDLSFPERVLAQTRRYVVPVEHIAFELTETSVAKEPVTALDILTRLRLKGVKLSIDDFGTGHSSLKQLQRLPFTELKIDMSFVRNLDTDASSRAIVNRSVALAHDLGLTVVAEGVENARIWELLCQAGCDLAQGYFIARPMPAEALLDWMSIWRPPTTR